MQRIPPELTSRARRMRTAPTPAEQRLWAGLRLIRPRFTRQLVIDRYIVDFACRSAKLVVEVDGGQHAKQIDEDRERTRYLEAQGWSVLRFWNHDVLENVDGVLDTILTTVSRAPTHPRPLPSREGR